MNCIYSYPRSTYDHIIIMMTSSGDLYPIQGRQKDNGEDESCGSRRSKVHKEKPLIDQTECVQGRVRRMKYCTHYTRLMQTEIFL